VNPVPSLFLLTGRLCRHASSRPSPPAVDASRDPDNVPAKAGNQTPNDVMECSLDSGSRPAKRSSSGMTGSANCHIVSKGRGDSCGAKLIVPKLSDSSGRHEYRQHHPCHSERQRRIFWVEPPPEILRRPAPAGLLRMTVNGESLNLGNRFRNSRIW